MNSMILQTDVEGIAHKSLRAANIRSFQVT